MMALFSVEPNRFSPINQFLILVKIAHKKVGYDMNVSLAWLNGLKVQSVKFLDFIALALDEPNFQKVKSQSQKIG